MKKNYTKLEIEKIIMSKMPVFIEVSELEIPLEYQREINKNHVDRLVREFNPYHFEPISVSRRDNKNYVYNGQHRVEAVKKLGLKLVPAVCFEGLSIEEEAVLFAEQSKATRSITPHENLKALITGKDFKSITIKKIADKHNFSISRKKSVKNSTTAVNSLRYVYEEFGEEVLDTTLGFLDRVWGGSLLAPAVFTGSFIEGVAYFINNIKGKDVNLVLFAKKLDTITMEAIVRGAKANDSYSSVKKNIALVLMNYYNKGRKENKKLELEF